MMLLKLQEAMVESSNNIEDAAEYILSTLERNGMMPPFSNDIFMTQSAQWGPAQAMGHDWDPE